VDTLPVSALFGTGTATFLTKWASANVLGSSIMSEAGTVVTVGGSLLATALTLSGLTSGLIPQAGVSGLLANSALGTSGITGTLTLSKSGSTARTATFPDTAIVVAGSAAALTSGLIPQAGASGILADSAFGTSGITGTLTLSKSGSTARTATFPDAAITVAGLSVAQSWSGVQTFAAASTIIGTDPGGSDLLRVGGSLTVNGSFSFLPVNSGDFAAGRWSRDGNWGTFLRAAASGTIADIAFADSAGTVMVKIKSGAIVLGGTDPGGSDLLRIGGALTINSTRIMSTKTSFTNGAAAAAGTLANAPAAGNPTKWIPIDDNGTTRHIPAW